MFPSLGSVSRAFAVLKFSVQKNLFGIIVGLSGQGHVDGIAGMFEWCGMRISVVLSIGQCSLILVSIQKIYREEL